MLYSKQNNWAFVHVPKNAGTSVEAPFTKLSKFNFREERLHFSVNVLNLKPETHHNKWNYWSERPEVKGLTPSCIVTESLG